VFKQFERQKSAILQNVEQVPQQLNSHETFNNMDIFTVTSTDVVIQVTQPSLHVRLQALCNEAADGKSFKTQLVESNWNCKKLPSSCELCNYNNLHQLSHGLLCMVFSRLEKRPLLIFFWLIFGSRSSQKLHY